MAILVNAHGIKKGFAHRPLFESLTFGISSGERIGLIGPNGAGKSTLLKVLAGEQSPDAGNLAIQKGLRVGLLEQVPKFTPDATVGSSVMEGSENPFDWEEIVRAQEIMAKLSLSGGDYINEETPIENLSGGWKKRVALARELLKQPDLLLLDEPTNHLDVESILWLEDLLARSRFATLTITHDRVFLQKVSNKIMEIDRRNPGGLLSATGDYATFLERKEELLAQQASTESKLRNTLRREMEWLRRGAKARITKQQARIQRVGELADTVSELAYRNATSNVQLDFLEAGKKPKKLVSAEGISVIYEGREILPKMDLLITPKSRIGLLGPNGCGKSTLIKVLLKLEEPTTGTVFHSENLKISYFEQNRDSLDQEISVLKTICPVGEHLDYNDRRIHARSYLDRFLFTGNQVEQPVGRLSGGEQSRLLLAKLMLEPANMLVLDEPTNDLDMATLDMLQEVLVDYKGAVVLVTHDRYFLDQVANQILGWGVKPNGKKEIISFTNLEQWENWHESQPEPGKKEKEKSGKKTESAPNEKRKLTHKEQRELDGMEELIAKTEARLAGLTEESTKPEFAANAKKLQEITAGMSVVQAELQRLYARWSELEALK
ncbi:MAG: ABC-F family ATP-binding cassette domain-containing protein [Bacteriovoracia bacterium]